MGRVLLNVGSRHFMKGQGLVVQTLAQQPVRNR